MAGALVRGWVSSGLVGADQVVASVPEQDDLLLEPLRALGCQTTHDNLEAVRESDVVLLGVKPHVVPLVAQALRNKGTGQLLLSVAAGLDTGKLAEMFGSDWRLVRAMPNTAVTVGEGATVYCLGPGSQLSDGDLVSRLFSSVGLCARVQETQIDAVTGVSGSGPAYMYLIMEAMADEGVRQGLDRATSYQLAAQTMVGAGKMVLTTRSHPGVLKDEVASPGGSTAAAIRALELGGLRGVLMSAVAAAAERCRDINR